MTHAQSAYSLAHQKWLCAWATIKVEIGCVIIGRKLLDDFHLTCDVRRRTNLVSRVKVVQRLIYRALHVSRRKAYVSRSSEDVQTGRVSHPADQ